ncbi:hypothetical protein [Psychromonas ossibalaenae]|uniref:hypothetical protein n=1 Tax=Psychromonas ossibalaenae TaxID=444922 RepID=UPI0003A10156|nr:hypothetical protein [Psychromonas ossibalaenae]
MVYFIGLLMGYFIGTNLQTEQQVHTSEECAFPNQTFALLSSYGALGGWFCVVGVAYVIGLDYKSGFIEGLYFVIFVLAGALFSGLFKIPAITPLTCLVHLPCLSMSHWSV